VETLYIIDAYAQFFRAYHAIRAPMTSPVTKEPTNMTFGFVGSLLKLLRGDTPNMLSAGGSPTYLVVATDVSGDLGTFRSQLYPDYKAHRPPAPVDLEPQVERCTQILETMGVPILGAEGFEADDAIATLVDQARARGVRVRIISKDKDLKQLFDAASPDAVELYDPKDDSVENARTLMEDTGLTPPQVIDMLALMGDTVDNVPGVPGVGPKTASQLIAQYGTLHDLLERAEEIKGKRGEAIRETAPALPLSRELVTLRHDTPVTLDLDAARTSGLDLRAILPILRDMGFNTHQRTARELLGEDVDAPDAPSPRNERAFEHMPSASNPAAAPAKNSASRGSALGTLFESVPDPTGVHAVAAQDGEYRCVRTRADLDELLAELRTCKDESRPFAFDTETTDLHPRRALLAGISIATRAGAGWYVPVRSPEPESHLSEQVVLDALRDFFEDASLPKRAHNAKYDMLVLRQAGVMVRGVGTHEGSCDSMIASFLVDASRSSHGLDALAKALLDRTNIPISDLIGSGKNQRTFDQVPLTSATPYAAEDADVTLRLCDILMPQVRAMGLSPLLYDLEMPLIEVLAEMEWNGIRVDPDVLEAQRAALAERAEALRNQIIAEAERRVARSFNPDSPKQLAGVLFNASDDDERGLGLKPVKQRKTGPSTDEEVLTKLSEDPLIETTIPALMLEYRELTKLVNTYLESLKHEILPDTGRIHTSFHQTGAATGRLSSSDPNLQNIPIRTDVGRQIRRAFVAEPGCTLITADYSQIELRILAHLSEDPGLIDAFIAGEDIHAAVAGEVHGIDAKDVTREQRAGAKMVNFGIVYGITPFGLARRLGVSNTEAEEIITRYKKRFARITTFLAECVEHARAKGYVRTMLGRRRPVPDIDSNVPNRRAFAERIAINSVVQGSAADLIKLAMVDLHRRLAPSAAHWREGAPPEIEGVRMLLQIHDELVFESPEPVAKDALALVKSRMESAMSLRVPLVADAACSRNWYEGK
jgi:DNA polymerase-1